MANNRLEIRQWLGEKGYTPDEIRKILDELDRYDELHSRESLFDDLATGEFDIGAIIKAALKEE